MPSILYEQRIGVEPATTPAEARGVAVSGAVGAGLQEVGQQGTRLAADINRMDYMQQEADGVAQLQKNMSDGYRNFTQSLEDWKGEVEPNGAGYTDKFVSAYDQWSNQLIEQQKLPRLKRMAAEQARTMGDHFFSQATQWQVGTNRAWRINSFDESINTDGSTLQQNPELFDNLLKDKLSALDAMKGLHPTDYLSLKNKVTSTYAEAAAIGAAQKAPQWTANTLLGTQPLPQGSIPQKIVQAARSGGVNPQAALAIAQFESGMNPAAQNKSSVGLYQFQPGTAAQYGLTDRLNPDENIKAGVKFIADNQRAFRDTFKRDPTLPELYSMHLLGLGGGMALAKSPDDMPFADLAARLYKNPEAVQNANHLAGMTVGQVKATLAGWMQKASNQTAGMANAPAPGEMPEAKDMPEFFKQLTPQGRQAILTHAQTLLRKDDSAARAAVKGRVNDALAAYQRGESVQDPPTIDTLVNAGMPYNEAADTDRTLRTWQAFGSQYAQVKTLPPDQQLALFNSTKPDPNMAGYATAAEAHDALGKAIQYVNQQRGEDPIRYDQGDGLKVTQPLDFSAPDVFTVQMNKRYTAAEQVAKNSGTGYTPFSKQEAYHIGEALTTADAKSALQNLALMRASAPTQDHFNAAMRQLAPKHPMLATAGQLAQTNPDAALAVLKGERMLHPPDGSKADIAMPTEDKFKARWNADMGMAFDGLPETSEANKQAVIAYYVATTSADKRGSKEVDPDAWQAALDAVVPSTDFNGRKTLVPPGVDPAKFPDLITQRWDDSLRAAGLDPSQYPSDAYQLTSAGQDGVYIPTNGTFPLTAGGRPVVIDLNAAPNPPPAGTPLPRKPLAGRKLTIDDIKRFR